MEQPPLPPIPPTAHLHHHQYRNQSQNLRACNHLKMAMPPLPISSQGSDNDRSSGELRALDCNLTSLCDHIQLEGFSNGSFSDIVVHAMGSTYHLHRLILSRSSYFRNMLHGPWKEATAPVVSLQIDDKNVNQEAIALALAYLYGHYPKLNDSNAYRVLAAASFLDLQVFAENQDYGIHGERVRIACWGYLCQSGSMELREVLPKLSSHTLHGLLTSNELWVPSEERRFELALDTLLKKARDEHHEKEGVSVEAQIESHQLADKKGKNPIDSSDFRSLESSVGHILDDTCARPHGDPKYPMMDKPSSITNPFSDTERNRSPYSYFEMPVNFQTSGQGCDGMPVEGPSEESLCYQFSNNNWLSESDLQNCSLTNSSCSLIMPNEWSGYDMHLSWGGRVVGKRQTKRYVKDFGVGEEEYDTFNTIFEGGSLLYCNMSFEALLNVRKQLEELGFGCKAVNDGLWLQV
ncbi:hypothetical protein V2J09_008688 [Rumex salicifolius]